VAGGLHIAPPDHYSDGMYNSPLVHLCDALSERKQSHKSTMRWMVRL
jgi:hypothetical protein